MSSQSHAIQNITHLVALTLAARLTTRNVFVNKVSDQFLEVLGFTAKLQLGSNSRAPNPNTLFLVDAHSD